MKPSLAQWLTRLARLFEIPAPDPARLLHRIVMMERNIILPVKAVFIGMISYSFDVTAWINLTSGTLDVVVETVQFIFPFYILASVILAAILFAAERLPLAVVQWTVFTNSLVDGIFIAGMVLLALCGPHHPQCRERAAGCLPIDFEFAHQHVLCARVAPGGFGLSKPG